MRKAIPTTAATMGHPGLPVTADHRWLYSHRSK
jgi:hypothetical protein